MGAFSKPGTVISSSPQSTTKMKSLLVLRQSAGNRLESNVISHAYLPAQVSLNYFMTSVFYERSQLESKFLIDDIIEVF